MGGYGNVLWGATSPILVSGADGDGGFRGKIDTRDPKNLKKISYLIKTAFNSVSTTRT